MNRNNAGKIVKLNKVKKSVKVDRKIGKGRSYDKKTAIEDNELNIETMVK